MLEFQSFIKDISPNYLYPNSILSLEGLYSSSALFLAKRRPNLVL